LSEADWLLIANILKLIVYWWPGSWGFTMIRMTKPCLLIVRILKLIVFIVRIIKLICYWLSGFWSWLFIDCQYPEAYCLLIANILKLIVYWLSWSRSDCLLIAKILKRLFIDCQDLEVIIYWLPKYWSWLFIDCQDPGAIVYWLSGFWSWLFIYFQDFKADCLLTVRIMMLIVFFMVRILTSSLMEWSFNQLVSKIDLMIVRILKLIVYWLPGSWTLNLLNDLSACFQNLFINFVRILKLIVNWLPGLLIYWNDPSIIVFPTLIHSMW
jgi:hypothetical protein